MDTQKQQRNRLLLGLGALVVLVGPLLVIKSDTGAMTYYLGAGYPPGQTAYIMMRYAGYIAFGLIFLQIILGLHHARLRRWTGTSSLVPLHRAIGLSAMAFALLHPFMFAWARFLRTGQSAVKVTFWPPRHEGYYELHQFYGALGLYILIVGVLAGIFGPRLSPRHWRVIHGVNVIVFFLVWLHSFNIGSDTRVGPLPLLYTAMVIMVAVLLVERLTRRFRQGPRPAPAQRPT
jgi:predicted ferric reductase